MERFLSEMMIEDVHEAASRNVLVCYGCVAMPGLVNLGRSRKEDKVNSSTATTHKRGYVAQQGAMERFRPDFEVYVNLQVQSTSILSYKQEKNRKEACLLTLSPKIWKSVKKMHIFADVLCGGDRTMHIVDKFTDLGLNLIGVPKYIDNDFSPTPMSHSAVTFATETIGCLRTTGSVHDWVMVIKVLGRNAGWIALGSGLVGGADVILIPEIPFQRGKICQTVHKQGKHGRKFSILCVAECAKPSVRRARCP